MISFDFEYYRPSSKEEATEIYMELHKQNKNPLFYGGGTEIITMARLNKIHTGAIIDIKGIPECSKITTDNDNIVLGSAVTLTEIRESDVFPLLSQVLKNLADHTSRCKITLGGNICSKIPYREAVLPFMLCNSTVEIFGPDGLKTLKINSVFHKTMNLQKGEFITRIITHKTYTERPFMAVKKTKSEKVDYPLISIAAIKNKASIAAAFSGVCNYPFMLDKVNIKKLKSSLPDTVISDNISSSEYRSFVLKNTVEDIINKLEA